MTTRYFELSDGKSHKFWEIRLDGSEHTVNYGRIGTNGQSKTKTFDSPEEAQKSCDKLVAQKMKKGYVEASESGGPVATAPVAAPKPKAKPAKKKRAATEQPKTAASPAPVDAEGAFAWHDGLTEQERYWCLDAPRKDTAEEVFDLKRCLERQSRFVAAEYRGLADTSGAAITAPMSKLEANFWFQALKSPDRPKTTARKLAKVDFAELPKASDVVSAMCASPGENAGPDYAAVVATLLGEDELHDLFAAAPTQNQRSWGGLEADERFSLFPGFRPHIAPRLRDDQLSKLKDLVRGGLSKVSWCAGDYDSPSYILTLAAALGFEEVDKIVAGWPDKAYGGDEWIGHYNRPMFFLLHMVDASQILSQAKRTSVRARYAWHVKALIARLGFDAIDFIVDSVCAAKSRTDAERLVNGLAQANHPAVARAMIDIIKRSKAAAPARQWLSDHPAAALIGLAPILGRGSQAAEYAATLLIGLRRQGQYDALFDKALELLEEASRKALTEHVIDAAANIAPEMTEVPDWLSAGFDVIGKKGKVPQWISLAELPRLVIDGESLPDNFVEVLIRGLAQGKEETFAVVKDVAARVDAAVADQWGWQLFEQWQSAAAPTKDKWALLAVGLVGGDPSALKLAPLVRKWPGQSQHARAVIGLKVLENIGTDTALMQINGIAQKLKFKALKAAAREAMEQIAKKRGMTKAELEDRIVPDCGLDERGERTFDFGPRKFSFVLDNEMKPKVKNEAGKVMANLPKPGKKDDASVAEPAVAQWKLLKKQIRDVAKLQVARMEQAMVTGRRWKPADFNLFLVQHPLMTHVVRMLLWGCYDQAGKLVQTFRVTDERELATVSDDPLTIEDPQLVGVVHPLEIDKADAERWGEMFSDYEIMAPFPQLGRPTHALTAEEQRQKKITRFADHRIGANTMVRTLENLDWQRGEAWDGGVFCQHRKPFYSAGVTAVVNYEGVPMGYMEDWDDQQLEWCVIVDGIHHEDVGGWMGGGEEKFLPLKEVSPIVVSEVLADLHTVAAKAR